MNQIATPLLLALALLAATTSLAPAAVPSAANSSLPACMALCPMGDMPFTVIVRDFANNPVPGSTVVLDFSGCPNGAFICTPLPTDPYITNLGARTLSMTADASGKVTFPARIGGTGPAGCAAVFADGVLMRHYALASPDQGGDGQVVLVFVNDLTLFSAKLGSADPTADFDCSGGAVNPSDQTILFAHASHGCFGFVDAVNRRTWGSLKLHYR